jgi:hypothetical protein
MFLKQVEEMMIKKLYNKITRIQALIPNERHYIKSGLREIQKHVYDAKPVQEIIWNKVLEGFLGNYQNLECWDKIQDVLNEK